MSGPRLAFALCAAQAALFAAAFWLFGDEEAGLAALVRFSARTAFALFLLVYAAAPLRRLWAGPVSRWLLRNRRYLGLSFAWALALHGIAIAMLALVQGDAFVTDPLVMAVGGGAYALTAAMALTSSDRAVRRLGPRRWSRLHRTGLHWLWVVFTFDWTVLALEDPVFSLVAGLAWGAAALRFAAWRKRRRAATTAPPAAGSRLGEALDPIR